MLEDDAALLRREPFLLSGLASASELCMLVGDAAGARQLYDALLPYEDRCGNVSYGVATHGPIARHVGRLAMKMGDEQTAERHLKRALAAAEAMPSVTYTGIACLSYSVMLFMAGRPDARPRAISLLRRAFALVRRAGLRGIMQLCRDVGQRVNVAVEAHSDGTAIVANGTRPDRIVMLCSLRRTVVVTGPCPMGQRGSDPLVRPERALLRPKKQAPRGWHSGCNGRSPAQRQRSSIACASAEETTKAMDRTRSHQPKRTRSARALGVLLAAATWLGHGAARSHDARR